MQQALARHLSFCLWTSVSAALLCFFKAHCPASWTYVFSNTTNEGVLEPNWASLQWADCPRAHCDSCPELPSTGAGWLSHNICSIWKFYLKSTLRVLILADYIHATGSKHSDSLQGHSWAFDIETVENFYISIGAANTFYPFKHLTFYIFT